MPRVTWDTQADWARFYRATRNGAVVDYGRAWATDQYGEMYDFERRLDALLGLGITPTDRVIVAGCGFGFLMEVAHNRGYPWWGGIESSSTIEARRGVEAIGSTLWVQQDMRGTGWSGLSRNLQRDLGVPGAQRTTQWDWVVTESLLESYDDSEILAPLNQGGLLAICEWALQGTNRKHIVHIVFTGEFSEFSGNQWFPFSGFNSKPTLEDWAALNPTHSWMDAETKRVI